MANNPIDDLATVYRNAKAAAPICPQCGERVLGDGCSTVEAEEHAEGCPERAWLNEERGAL